MTLILKRSSNGRSKVAEIGRFEAPAYLPVGFPTVVNIDGHETEAVAWQVGVHCIFMTIEEFTVLYRRLGILRNDVKDILKEDAKGAKLQ